PVMCVVISVVLIKVIDLLLGFRADEREEIEGLDRTEHGETGFDLGLAMEAVTLAGTAEPRPALVPPNGQKRFHIVIDGASQNDLMKAWSDLCQPGSASPDFKAVYPNVTTVQGNRFLFRGGDQARMRDSL